MDIIKRHRGLAIVGGLTLVLLIVLFAIFSRMLFSTGKSEYGDRLNGIVKIPESELNSNKAKILENEQVIDAKIRTQGKIIYTTITVNASTNKDKAKEIASKTLEYYSDEVKECYDFEFLISQKVEVKEGEEDKSYAIAGTKHVNNEKISWTKN